MRDDDRDRVTNRPAPRDGTDSLGWMVETHEVEMLWNVRNHSTRTEPA